MEEDDFRVLVKKIIPPSSRNFTERAVFETKFYKKSILNLQSLPRNRGCASIKLYLYEWWRYLILVAFSSSSLEIKFLICYRFERSNFAFIVEFLFSNLVVWVIQDKNISVCQKKVIPLSSTAIRMNKNLNWKLNLKINMRIYLHRRAYWNSLSHICIITISMWTWRLRF